MIFLRIIYLGLLITALVYKKNTKDNGCFKCKKDLIIVSFIFLLGTVFPLSITLFITLLAVLGKINFKRRK